MQTPMAALRIEYLTQSQIKKAPESLTPQRL